MMDYRIRLFQDNLIAIINDFSDIPLEARRVVLENVTNIVEKKADEAIIAQHKMMEEEDVKDIFKDKLGELPQ